MVNKADKKDKKVLILAGGTGGHIIPGLSVANELCRNGYEVLWLGTKQGLEAQLVPENGIPIHYIYVAGIRKKNLLTMLTSISKLLLSLLQCLWFMYKLKPDLVVGMGGFVAGPGGIAAWIFRVPLIIHEQNSIPGVTNVILARLSKQVLEGFPDSFKKVKKFKGFINLQKICHKIQFIGNPVRIEFNNLKSFEERKKEEQKNKESNLKTGLKILIIGGSRGAKALNLSIPLSLQDWPLSKDIPAPDILHQTGKLGLKETRNNYQNGENIHYSKLELIPFIHDVVKSFSWADLVICRAGALTIAELTASGIGSILVPFPYAVDDHQTRNAEYLVNKDAAILIQEKDLIPSKLQKELVDLTINKERIFNMAKNAASLFNKDALSKIVSCCCKHL